MGKILYPDKEWEGVWEGKRPPPFSSCGSGGGRVKSEGQPSLRGQAMLTRARRTGLDNIV